MSNAIDIYAIKSVGSRPLFQEQYSLPSVTAEREFQHPKFVIQSSLAILNLLFNRPKMRWKANAIDIKI